MIRYKILHRTYYNFDAPVALGPHTLRLRPREDQGLRIASSMLRIEPDARLEWLRDAEDNSVVVAHFGGPTQQLSIESELIVDQYNLAPIPVAVADGALTLPVAYSCEDAVALAPYRCPQVAAAQEDPVATWLHKVRVLDGAANALDVLLRLNTVIHGSLAYRVRREAGVNPPEVTLALGAGACRDFATLFMEVARRLGLAARFVSGYLRAEPSWIDYGSTHAWVEVYLPGAGWKGFDPTTGQLACRDHFPVAVGVSPGCVPPVSGSFTGSATSTLDVGVWVTELR